MEKGISGIIASLKRLELIFSDPSGEREAEMSIGAAIELTVDEIERTADGLCDINNTINTVGSQIVDKLDDINNILTDICRVLNTQK